MHDINFQKENISPFKCLLADEPPCFRRLGAWEEEEDDDEFSSCADEDDEECIKNKTMKYAR
jgi:hypothetical protein